MRVTAGGAVLVGTNTAPTESDSPGALTVQEKIIISNINAGRSQTYAGDPGAVNSTGGIRFNFQNTRTGVNLRSSAFVRIIVNQRANNDNANQSPSVEAKFVLWRSNIPNATQLVNLQLGYGWVYDANDISGSILGSGEGYRVTVANPLNRPLNSAYQVEITSRDGEWYLASANGF